MSVCARASEGGCSGRITWEHVWGRRVQEDWMIVALCWFHHLGPGMSKEKNKYLAYLNCSDEDLKRFKLYEQMKAEKAFLIKRYDIEEGR